jgi:t-SNARE complex subunit (syntaxin)
MIRSWEFEGENLTQIPSSRASRSKSCLFSMTFRSPGAFRDRMGDLLSFRGGSFKSIHANYDVFDSSLAATDIPESALEPFFQLAREIKQDLSDLEVSFDNLLKKHKECLRPTFADSADVMGAINSLTGSIDTRMQSIRQRIASLVINSEYPDRKTVISNLRSQLTDRFKEFSAKFKLTQQAFSATFMKVKEAEEPGEFSFSDLDFGLSSARQVQIQNQHHQEEIQEIARRSEQIRDIFYELATLIHDQGTLIDRIDVCIQGSLENATEAHAEVEKAASYQKKSRMWICVVILCIVLVVLFLMALFK